MFIQRCVVLNLLFSLVFFASSEVLAQSSDAKTAMASSLFNSFMRRGDLPWEFEISIRKTGVVRSGAYIGAIFARNATIEVAGRREPVLFLKAYLNNLSPGLHALSIHQNPDCGPKERDGIAVPGLAAGPYAFPARKTGLEVVSYEAQLSNLPYLRVRADGASTQELIAPRLTLADLVNRSIIVNANQDGSSPAEACGVLY